MIEMRGLMKVYGLGDTEVRALRGIDLRVRPGEMVAIMGPSGSGKSTLMNVLGCLDRPSSGTYVLDGQEVSTKSDNQLAEIRNLSIGFIFQGFNLLSKLTAAENVETPLIYRLMPAKERRARVAEALKLVGLSDRMHHKPAELSGGQQQRVAIARAIAGGPAILLGDEPTGALDSRTGLEVLGIFQDLHRQGRTIVLVTHDEKVGQHCERVVRLQDGLIIQDEQIRDRMDARAELAKLPPLKEVG